MKRTFALLAAALALASCASDKDQKNDPNSVPKITNPYSLEGTTIPVGVIPAGVLHDPQRNKDIEMSIEYPTRGGPYPVIIFSPEYGGSRASYVGLSAFWAGHGYVVIKPSHSDAGATRDALDRMAAERRAAAEAQAQNRGNRGNRGRDQQPNGNFQNMPFRPDPSQIWETATSSADWNNRLMDVRFIIDSLPTLVAQYPEIKERVDATRIGVGGHAYGALTALMTAGAAGANADARVKAVEAMSPPGPLPNNALTEQSFANVRVPVLFLTGSRDLGAAQNEDVVWRHQAYAGSPAGDKWFINIQGAGRSAFTGNFADFGYEPRQEPGTMAYPTNRPPVGGYYPPAQQPMNQRNQGLTLGGGSTGIVRTVSLAFWDDYLKSDKPGRDYMNQLKSRGDMQVETK